jgi:glycosyltransferase involved in cell wall biosynthesis
MDERPRLSLVIPAYNEQENVPVLLERVEAALKPIGERFEVIIVDDGSTDQTEALLAEGMKRYDWLRVLRMAQNGGQSAAFDAGFKAARGEIIATIDADLQNDPQEIPRLLGMMDGYDMITGWRQKRNDTFGRRVQTRIANGVRNWISGETIHDSASSLKLYRRQCLAGMQLYNGMHRFMPTLVKIRGGRVLETPVSHSQRYAGTAKYGLRNRAFRALVDLFAVRWMKKRWLRYEVKEVDR